MLRSTLADFIDLQCVPRLAAAEVYGKVQFDDLRRRYLRGRCPFDGSHAGPESFVVDAWTLRWSCLDHCQKGGQSVLSYLNGGSLPQAGGELRALVERLALGAGVPSGTLPEISKETDEEFRAHERVAGLLETFFLQAHTLLHSAQPSVRQSAEAFLARHGLVGEPFDDLPIGLAADMRSVRRGLEMAGFTAQEIDASALTADERLAGRLVGPIRDRSGRILSFWARDPLDRSPRVLFKGSWKEETALVGLDAAFHGAGSRREHVGDLLVLERVFDALVLQGLGFSRAAAVAGPASDLTRARWERLAALGVRRVTLVPDDSGVSRRNALVAVESAFRAKPSPDVWVLLPEGLGQHPTAAELVRARGLREFQTTLQARLVHAYRYKALALLEQHRPASGWTEIARHRAWKEAIEFYATSDTKSRPNLDAHFVPAIVAGLQRSWDAFEPQGRTSTEVATLEAPPPRPPISVPLVATRSLGPPGPTETISLAVAPARVADPAGVPRRPARNGANGYCHLHHCDTTVCFCFD